MEDAIEPPIWQPGDALQEHLELSHYVETYRHSAERVRYIVFISMILSIIVLVAQWNTASPSWLRRRLDKLEKTERLTRGMDTAGADATVKKVTRSHFESRQDLVTLLDDYRTIVAERVMVVEIPGLGTTFDVNDLGLFSGVAFFLLLLLLVFALMREYENLYLALSKVRRLYDSSTSSRGESLANYLYHALAMSQVFNAPPTLAVWRPSLLKRIAPLVIFLLPAVVQTYVISVNLASLRVADAYDVPRSSVIVPEVALLAMVLAMAGIAALYANACNYRWRSAFGHINPAFRRVEPLPWGVWLRLPFRANTFGGHLQRRFSAQLVQGLKIAQDRSNLDLSIRHSIEIDGTNINYAEIQRMYSELRSKAENEADAKCEEFHILRGEVESSVLHDRDWRVVAKFSIRCSNPSSGDTRLSADGKPAPRAAASRRSPDALRANTPRKRAIDDAKIESPSL